MKKHTATLMLFVAIALVLFSCEPTKSRVIKQAVTDIDGNTYDAVKIGDQIWMAGNLAVTHLNDGTDISQKCNEHAPFGIYYDHTLLKEDSIRLRLCPQGWHVPTKAEWETLINNVESNGKMMAKSGNVAAALSAYPHINATDIEEFNSSQFSAIPTGYWYSWWSYAPTNFGTAMKWLNRRCYFWTSTINEGNGDPFVVYFEPATGDIQFTASELHIPNVEVPTPGTGGCRSSVPVRCVKSEE
ncbi:MAG: fibrobacter succinogenes major paralogous domain-containing protein [Bacteroidales bacterium]|nr:fibrobacter succinogenes major paralogous domain-containing protein [Bacteroidales bacterium]